LAKLDTAKLPVSCQLKSHGFFGSHTPDASQALIKVLVAQPVKLRKLTAAGWCDFGIHPINSSRWLAYVKPLARLFV
jgi:hypothetical protein